MSHNISNPFLFIIAFIGLAGIILALFYPFIFGKNQAQKRLTSVVGNQGKSDAKGRKTVSDDAKRKDIEKALRELEERQKGAGRSRVTLLIRLRQAGLNWGKQTYFIISAILAVAICILNIVWGLDWFPALAFGAMSGLVMPHFYVSIRRSRRMASFAKDFPNAIDIIVRGVKSGLPVADCLRIISIEAAEPVRSEFREIVEDQTVGLAIDQATGRLAERVPLAETRFFAIVIALQSRTGGNLSDALSGLSKVLRDRQKMHAKVRAMSSEAKSSAGIIGAVPVLLVAALKILSPEYMDILFDTFAGRIIIAGCIVWMGIGVFIMSKMIRFDF
jgi:tight adherence protein B